MKRDVNGYERGSSQSPHTFGKDTSIWTLELAAEVSFTRGIVSRPISGETSRNALKLLGIGWKRAKHWITSPDPDDVRKKHRRDSLIRLVRAHPSWALGFLDEVWWSRVAQPDQHRWVEEDDLTRLQELECSQQDTDPKALACYGVLLRRQEHDDQMLLRFVDGRPGSWVTIDFLTACCQELAAQSITALVLIWDHARLPEESDRSHLATQPSSDGQAKRLRRAYPVLPLAHQKSLAQPN